LAIKGSIEITQDNKRYSYDELSPGQLVVYGDGDDLRLSELKLVTEKGLASLDGRLQIPVAATYTKLPVGTKIVLEVTE
jgi:hypothetical protein